MAAKRAIARRQQESSTSETDEAVGKAIKSFRAASEMTVRKLAEFSGVSAAMISRIEKGQVSPSLTTLTSLARALEVPLISLFHHTIETADITHVVGGKGLKATRLAKSHSHDFAVLGYHKRRDIRFEPLLVTLHRDKKDELPAYHEQGCVFLYVLEGKAIYRYGDREFHLAAGDSLCFDAAVRHGFKRIITDVVRFLSVFSQRA